MKIRACPLCRQVVLIPSAATVTCGTCGFPMTRHALSVICQSDIQKSERTTDLQRR